jgi:PhnB protein
MAAMIETDAAPLREITLVRSFNAPRRLVFQAFTDPSHLAQWWGPRGYTAPVCELEARPGGALRIDMRAPDGAIFSCTGTVREVVPLERFAFTIALHETDGSIRLENLNTVTFAEDSGRTTIILHVRVLQATAAAEANLAGMQAGWSGSLERLATLLGGTPTMQAQPYLFFDGRCDEALAFYGTALGAEVTMLMRFKNAPDPELVPRGGEDRVMHARVRIGDTVVMASDGRCLGKPDFQGFALSLTVSDEAEADRVFGALSDGGQVQMPLAKTFFSPRFGMVTDRFGVMWMVLVQ